MATSWPYQDMNRREVIQDDNQDADTSWRNHQARGSAGGVDHNAPIGTPIRANSAGRVSLNQLSAGGSGGRTVKVTDSNGWRDEYLHLSQFAVSDGQTVRQGQIVGYSGGSGNGRDLAYVPHLHLHRYTAGGDRVNAWHYFAGDGKTDMRNVKPGKIVATLTDGEPNITFWRRLQWYAHLNGYDYTPNGFMSISAWKGVQRGLKNYGYTGVVDGVPGSLTYKALQTMAHKYGSTSAIDGTLSNEDYIGISQRLNLL